MKILRFNEAGDELIYPSKKVLQMMYGHDVPDPENLHVLKMKYMQDVNSGKYKKGMGTVSANPSSTEVDLSIDIRKDIATKISEILRITLSKNDKTFLDKVNALVKEYEHLIPKVNPNAKVVDIDEPFKDKSGKFIKYDDKVGQTESVFGSGDTSEMGHKITKHPWE